MPSSAQIGNLAVNLSLETAAFQRGAAQAEARAKTLQTRLGGISNSMKGFAGGLVAGIGVSAISGLVSNAFQLAAALDESAQKMGVSVEALQELNFAAEQSGVKQETLATAIGRLNKSMGDLAMGAKPATEAFAKLGLTAEDLKNKSPDQALRIIADALNKLPSVQERVAVGQQIMGRNFSQLLPLINGGSAALDKYSESARKSGIITTQEAKSLDEMADTWERIKLRIGVAIAKSIAFLDQSVNGWYKWRSNVIKAVDDTVQGIHNAIVGRLSAVWNKVKSDVAAVGGWFHDLYEKVVGHSYIPDMVDQIGQHMARLDANMVQPAVAATTKAGQAFAELQSRVQGLLERLFPEQAAQIQFNKDLSDLEAYAKKAGMGVDELAEAVRRLREEYTKIPSNPLPSDSILNPPEPNTELDYAALGKIAGTSTSGGTSFSDRLKEIVPQLQRIADLSSGTFGKIAQSIVTTFIPALEKMQDATATAGDKMMAVGSALSSLFTSIFGKKTGGVLSAILTAGMSLAGLFKGGGGSTAGAIGMASGGSGIFGGRSGVDKNILSLNGTPIARVSRGERFNVGANSNAPQAKVMIVPSPYFDAVVDRRSAAVAAPMAGRAAMAGATGGMTGLMRRQARTLP